MCLSEHKFFQTVMGQRFYKHSIPSISKSLLDISQSLIKGGIYLSESELSQMEDNIKKLCKIEIQDDTDNFYQTTMGKRYYNNIIPDIANNLREIACSVRFSNEDMLKIIMCTKNLDNYNYELEIKEEPTELIVSSIDTGKKLNFTNVVNFIEFVESLEKVTQKV